MCEHSDNSPHRRDEPDVITGAYRGPKYTTASASRYSSCARSISEPGAQAQVVRNVIEVAGGGSRARRRRRSQRSQAATRHTTATATPQFNSGTSALPDPRARHAHHAPDHPRGALSRGVGLSPVGQEAPTLLHSKPSHRRGLVPDVAASLWLSAIAVGRQAHRGQKSQRLTMRRRDRRVAGSGRETHTRVRESVIWPSARAPDGAPDRHITAECAPGHATGVGACDVDTPRSLGSRHL